jgi:(p)ppGpp synthase/HD superfamily hydrolase
MSKSHNLSGSIGQYAQQLLDAVHAHNVKSVQPVNTKLVKKAINYLQVYCSVLEEEASQQAYTRSTKLALMLTSYYLTNESLIAALLYDLAQSQHITQEHVKKGFGKNIAAKLSKLLSLQVTSSNLVGLQHIEQVIAQGDRDILVIRLLDYLCTMERISTQPKYEQLAVAMQGIQTFVPLAAYMGLPMVETQLIDRCKLIVIPTLLKDTSATDAVIEIAGFKFQL